VVAQDPVTIVGAYGIIIREWTWGFGIDLIDGSGGTRLVRVDSTIGSIPTIKKDNVLLLGDISPEAYMAIRQWAQKTLQELEQLKQIHQTAIQNQQGSYAHHEESWLSQQIDQLRLRYGFPTETFGNQSIGPNES
jgi:hypothetical protein